MVGRRIVRERARRMLAAALEVAVAAASQRTLASWMSGDTG
jgi:hypothetical protein